MGTIKQLRWWAYKILPLVYDDSLSYYEVISKVTQKLNEVVDTTNKLPDAISEEIENQLRGEEGSDVFDNLFNGLINAIATKEADEVTYTPNEKQGGELVWLGDTLYEVTSPMASGTNYIVGTNIVPVDISEELEKIKGYISTHNEYFHERATQVHNAQSYLYWKDALYRADKDISVNDILGTDGQLTLVNAMDEITSHYHEMHEADNNLQTQIDGNDGDIEKLQAEDVNLQSQITGNNDYLTNRINNIVAQASTDNTELVDARLGAKVLNPPNGTTYQNIGEAIRGQISQTFDNTVWTTGSIISDIYIENNPNMTILTLPNNNMYRTAFVSQDNMDKIGLKGMHAPGSLVKFNAGNKSNESTEYTNYIYTEDEGNDTKIFYAYTFGNASVDSLVWHKIIKSRETIVPSNKIIDDSYLNALPNTSVINLPQNNVYSINITDTDKAINFGLKDIGKKGTLYSLSPLQDSNTTSFLNLIFITGEENNSTIYYSYLCGNETINSIVWHKIGTETRIINSVLDNTVWTTGRPISDEYVKDSPNMTILTLPNNNMYRTSLISQDNMNKIGLKGMHAPGSLVKFNAGNKSNESTEYTNYIYTEDEGNDTKIFYAYTFGNASVDSLVWHKIIKSRETIVPSDFFSRTDTVFSIPSNHYYMVGGFTREEAKAAGLPTTLNTFPMYGSLYKLRPSESNGNNFCELIFISETFATVQTFIAYLYGGETNENIAWNEIKYNRTKNISLGYQQNNIYLIGDSIVEGYGGTGYNGGSITGHSDEEIPNNVKTWYRNTQGTCWSNMLKSYMEENYPNTSVINNGIGGLTCQQINDNLDTLVPEDATMVIYSCGTNNTYDANKINTITLPIINLINGLTAKGIRVVVLTNTPQRTGTKPNNAATINAYIKTACDVTQAYVINIYAEFLKYIDEHDLNITQVTNDDLHPNNMGYKIMFEIIRSNLGW